MVRTTRRLGFSDLGLRFWLASLGFGSYWAWIDSAFFTTVLFGSFPDVARVASESYIVAQVAAIAITCICMAVSRTAPHLFAKEKAFALVAGIGTCGTILSFFSIKQGSGILFFAASLMLGVAMGALPLFWGTLLARDEQGKAALKVCGSIAIACAATVLLSYVETFGRLLITCCLLPFGLLCFAIMTQNVSDLQTETCGSQKSRKLRTFWRLLLALLASSFAFGSLQSSYHDFWLDFNLITQIQIIGRGAVAFMVLLAAGFFGRSYRIVYRAGLLLMIAAFLATPFLASSLPYFGGILVSMGYSCVELMMWTFAFEAIRQEAKPAFTIGFLRVIMMSGVLAGILTTPSLIGSPLTDDVRYAIGTTTIAYILVMSLMLLVDEQNPRGFWNAMNRSAFVSHEEALLSRCKAVSRQYELTDREAEVMRYLVAGRSAPFIANELFIAPSTVKYHTARLYSKLDVHSKQELIDLFERFETEPKHRT